MVSAFPYLFLNASLRDFFNAIFLRQVKEGGTKNLMRRRERRVHDSTSRAVGLSTRPYVVEGMRSKEGVPRREGIAINWLVHFLLLVQMKMNQKKKDTRENDPPPADRPTPDRRRRF